MTEMLTNIDSFFSEYVMDIPWNRSPAFAFSSATNAYMEAFHDVVDTLPVADQKIRFINDTWDFNPYFKNHNTKSYVINFSKCPDRLKDVLKFYALFSILGAKKISTVNVRCTEMIGCLRELVDTGHPTLFSVSLDDIRSIINNRKGGISHKASLYQAMYQLYLFIERNYHIALPVSSGQLHSEYDAIRENFDPDDHKLPDIPAEYFYQIRNMAYQVMRDDAAGLDERITAATLTILIETGLRISEVLSLPVSALRERTMSRTGHSINFIHYVSKKPSKAHQPVLEFDIFCTQHCKEAFLLLKEFRELTGFADGTEILILYPHCANSVDTFPVQNDRFRRSYFRLVYNHLQEQCTQPYRDAISETTYTPHRNENVTVYIPRTEQYRVHLCSYLYNERHVSLTWIERYMGHLSDAMAGYYVRPKENYQEDMKEFGKVIRDIHDKHLTPLGGDGKGPEIARRINQFIDENHFNVSTDIDEIAKTVEDRVIIRAKTGGVCIKTSLMPCSRDTRSNEVMCAFSLCPNLFHFYYMVDVSYNHFSTLRETVRVNQERGLIRAAQKELNKAQSLLRRRLIPELDEMDKEIERQGAAAIIEEYPSLEPIIIHEQDIRKEIGEWTTKRLDD